MKIVVLDEYRGRSAKRPPDEGPMRRRERERLVMTKSYLDHACTNLEYTVDGSTAERRPRYERLLRDLEGIRVEVTAMLERGRHP